MGAGPVLGVFHVFLGGGTKRKRVKSMLLLTLEIFGAGGETGIRTLDGV